MSTDPTAGTTGQAAPDLDAIEEKWLRQCAAHDAGMAMSCTCPEGDPRNVIDLLVTEVRTLRRAATYHVEREHLQWLAKCLAETQEVLNVPGRLPALAPADVPARVRALLAEDEQLRRDLEVADAAVAQHMRLSVDSKAALAERDEARSQLRDVQNNRLRQLREIGHALGCNQYDTAGQIADAAKRLVAERAELLAALNRFRDVVDFGEATTHMDVAEIVLHHIRTLAADLCTAQTARDAALRDFAKVERERDDIRLAAASRYDELERLRADVQAGRLFAEEALQARAENARLRQERDAIAELADTQLEGWRKTRAERDEARRLLASAPPVLAPDTTVLLADALGESTPRMRVLGWWWATDDRESILVRLVPAPSATETAPQTPALAELEQQLAEARTETERVRQVYRDHNAKLREGVRVVAEELGKLAFSGGEPASVSAQIDRLAVSLRALTQPTTQPAASDAHIGSNTAGGHDA